MTPLSDLSSGEGQGGCAGSVPGFRPAAGRETSGGSAEGESPAPPAAEGPGGRGGRAPRPEGQLGPAGRERPAHPDQTADRVSVDCEVAGGETACSLNVRGRIVFFFFLLFLVDCWI